MKLPLYYSDKLNDAIALSLRQYDDGWLVDDIQSYWLALGYDIFFTRQIIRGVENAQVIL